MIALRSSSCSDKRRSLQCDRLYIVELDGQFWMVFWLHVSIWDTSRQFTTPKLVLLPHYCLARLLGRWDPYPICRRNELKQDSDQDDWIQRKTVRRTTSNAHNMKWVCQHRKQRNVCNIMEQRKTAHITKLFPHNSYPLEPFFTVFSYRC